MILIRIVSLTQVDVFLLQYQTQRMVRLLTSEKPAIIY